MADKPWFPPYTDATPRWTQMLGRAMLRVIGWRVGDYVITPDMKKLVILGVFHTANMDTYLAIAWVLALGLPAQVLVKEEAFKGIQGWLLRRVKAIPIDRKAPNGVVGQVIDEFRKRDRLMLVMAPEGTRKYVKRWKTGFYYMALGAGVPIALGALDYRTKTVSVGKVMMPSGDIKADEAIFREHYASITPKHPEKAGPIVLTENAVLRREAMESSDGDAPPQTGAAPA